MKVYLTTLLAAFILLVAGCKKKPEETYNLKLAKVKSVLHSSSGTTETYTYNETGLVTLIQSSDGSKLTYNYNADTLLYVKYNASGAKIVSQKIVFDTIGLAQQAATFDSLDNLISFQKYTFNTDKQKTTQLDYDTSNNLISKYVWNWTSGILWEFIMYDSSQTTRVYNTYYEYYDPTRTSVGYENTGQTLWGIDPIYLTRNYKQFSYFYGSTLFTYQYTLDDKKRITTLSKYNYKEVLINMDTYTYY